MTDYSIYKLGDGVSLEIEKCFIKRNDHEMNKAKRWIFDTWRAAFLWSNGRSETNDSSAVIDESRIHVFVSQISFPDLSCRIILPNLATLFSYHFTPRWISARVNEFKLLSNINGSIVSMCFYICEQNGVL